MKKILFTGGGSAGHVVPNLAIIQELLQGGDIDVCYMGTDGIEKGLVAKQKIPFFSIACPKLVRGMTWTNLKRNLKIPFEFRRAKRQATEGLRLFQPDLVFSKGGYVALPVVFAAHKLGIPCLAHESDFSPGLANKLSARKCKSVLTSFPETAKKLPHGKYVGAPVRRELFGVSFEEARRRFQIPLTEKVLLIFGGGSGSAALNDGVRKHLETLAQKYTLLHVCGKGNVVECKMQRYRQFEFIADMGAAYACADLVISRAGSGAVFEILALKKPALLVPLEGATRGDQKENAAYFERRGLCRVLPQSQLDRLPQAVDDAFGDRAMRARLQETEFRSGNERIVREIREALR